MGYLTTFTIYNDASDSIKKDPKLFGERIYSAIGTTKPDEFGMPGYGSMCFVQESRHADDKTIYVHSGHCVTEVNPYSRGFKDLIKKNPDFARELVEFLDSEVIKLKKVLIEEMPIENLTFEEKIIITNNPNTSPEKLDCLANDKSDWVRSKVAQHPNTPPETLDRLSYDDHWCWLLRFYVAENLNTAPETLDRLSYDETMTVRCWVAKNPNTPLETLERLSYDDLTQIRRAVAQNPNTTPETLDRLSKDENGDVSCTAQQTLSNNSKE